MNITQAKDVLKANLEAQKNGLKAAVMLWGPPGVGKSSIVHQVAEELGFKGVIDVRLSTLSNIDVRGLPYIDKTTGVSKFSQPYFVPTEPGWLIFFDEVNTAPPANQVVAYEIALDRRIGGHPLPEGTVVVMAGNRAKDRGATHTMPVPLRNRMQHIEVEPDIDTTFEYGLRKGWDSNVLAFLKFKPDLLYQPPKGEQQAFPSPRSWEYVSNILKYDDSFHSIAGFVGDGAATEFLAFRKLASKLPDIKQTLETGKPFSHPEISVMFAYVTGLASHVAGLQKPTKKIVKNYINLLKEVPAELIPIGVLALQHTPAQSLAITLKEYQELFKRINSAVR